MRLSMTLLLLGAISFCHNTPAALHQSNERINFQYRAIGKAAWERIYVVSLIYPNVSHTVKSGEILTRMQKQYRNQKVEVIALLPTTQKNIDKFIADHPDFDFTVNADPEFKYISKLYNRRQPFPQTGIFNCAGKLLWSGDPLDLPMMLKLITGKKYSERTEIRIAALSSSLQAALRTGDPNLIGQAADQILALRPEQLSAVTAKAYSLEIAGDIAGLEKFFNDRIKRFPQVQENYFMLLEASLRLHPLAATAPQTAKSFIQNFPNEFESISAIAWTLLNNAPFDAAALAVVSDACAILQKAPAASVSGKILTTRALFAYRSCKLQEALNLLRQAYERTGNAQEKAFVKNMLEYLKAVEKSTR